MVVEGPSIWRTMFSAGPLEVKSRGVRREAIWLRLAMRQLIIDFDLDRIYECG